MHTALMIILLVASVILIISILLQAGNSDGLSGSIAGGAEQLFGKRKSRGYDAVLAKITQFQLSFILLFHLLSLRFSTDTYNFRQGYFTCIRLFH
jgi:preprotein translocase subunit SecG